MSGEERVIEVPEAVILATTQEERRLLAALVDESADPVAIARTLLASAVSDRTDQ